MTPIASKRHTAVLLAVLGLLAYAGYANRAPLTAPSSSHLPLYASVTASEWALFYLVWRGIRAKGIPLSQVMGMRWSGWREMARDVAIAAAFFLLANAVLWMYRQLAPGAPSTVAGVLPKGWLESCAFMVLSISAGVSEEFVFRGYLQQQFSAFAGSALAGIAGQALIFGVTHGYQGLQATLRITLYGLLFGLLAHWRNNLRPGMVAHAWQDIFSGVVAP